MNDIKIGVSSSSHETAEDKIVTVTFYIDFTTGFLKTSWQVIIFASKASLTS